MAASNIRLLRALPYWKLPRLAEPPEIGSLGTCRWELEVAKLPLPRPLPRLLPKPLPGSLPRLLLGRKPPPRLALGFFAAGTLWTAVRTDSAVGAAASTRPLSRALMSRAANASSAPCEFGASTSFGCSLRCTVDGPSERSSRADPSAIQSASRPSAAIRLCACSLFPLVPTCRSCSSRTCGLLPGPRTRATPTRDAGSVSPTSVMEPPR